jgi:4-hydroxybenzoate polyprenyltransferase
VYLLNDMLDLEADRQHPIKSARPFAAGTLPVPVGLVLMPALLIASFAIALLLPTEFLLVLAAYYVLTTVYSFLLKRFPLIDTLCLSCLYTIRVVAGAAATGVLLSPWLLLFSVFFFLSLAWVKRCAELDALQRNKKEQVVGRDYTVEDLLLLKMFGINAGYLSILVLALYINSDAVKSLYQRPQILWFLCLLMLFWISRIWLKTHHGKMHHDPVIFALKDKTSLVVGLLALLTLLAAT